MLLKLKSLFNGEMGFMPVDAEISMKFGDETILAKATGGLTAQTDCVRLDLEIKDTRETLCDRCLDPVEKQGKIKVTHFLVATMQDDENDRFLVAKDYEIDISEIVREEVLLSFPTKLLCSEDCGGLCPQCGINFNIEECDCETKEVDPRFEVLRQLLD